MQIFTTFTRPTKEKREEVLTIGKEDTSFPSLQVHLHLNDKSVGVVILTEGVSLLG